jgi:hypothetical protein
MGLDNKTPQCLDCSNFGADFGRWRHAGSSQDISKMFLTKQKT